MKTTRIYQSKCHNCGGTGVDYKQLDGINTSAVCIVCNGSKTITVIEIIEDNCIRKPTDEDIEREFERTHPAKDEYEKMIAVNLAKAVRDNKIPIE